MQVVETKVTSETVEINGCPVNISYDQHGGKVAITITPKFPQDDRFHAQMVCGAQAWVTQVSFDLYACNGQLHESGTTITLELDCPESQGAVVGKLRYLSENLKLHASL